MNATYWPFVVLLVSVGVVVLLITVVRLHAFLALILAAVTAGDSDGAVAALADHLAYTSNDLQSCMRMGQGERKRK